MHLHQPYLINIFVIINFIVIFFPFDVIGSVKRSYKPRRNGLISEYVDRDNPDRTPLSNISNMPTIKRSYKRKCRVLTPSSNMSSMFGCSENGGKKLHLGYCLVYLSYLKMDFNFLHMICFSQGTEQEKSQLA